MFRDAYDSSVSTTVSWLGSFTDSLLTLISLSQKYNVDINIISDAAHSKGTSRRRGTTQPVFSKASKLAKHCNFWFPPIMQIVSIPGLSSDVKIANNVSNEDGVHHGRDKPWYDRERHPTDR